MNNNFLVITNSTIVIKEIQVKNQKSKISRFYGEDKIINISFLLPYFYF